VQGVLPAPVGNRIQEHVHQTLGRFPRGLDVAHKKRPPEGGGPDIPTIPDSEMIVVPRRIADWQG